MMYMHLAAALISLALGAMQFVCRKGTRAHKTIGWIWVFAIAVACLSSFALHGFVEGTRFSWLHGLSGWTLICLFAMIYFVRKKNVRRHRNFAIGVYCGLLAAGLAATLMPHRFLYKLFFG